MSNIFKTIGKILSFPVLKIFIGVALINVSAFIMRNLTELLMVSIKIDNDLIISTFVFIVRILTLFFIYRLFIRIYEKREPEEFQLNKSSVIHFSLGPTLVLL